MRYKINWNYHSSICDVHGLGKLSAGGVVDLDDDVAAAINGDSPGVLSVDAPAPKPVADKPKPAARKAKGAQNRKAKPASNRAVTSEDE